MISVCVTASLLSLLPIRITVSWHSRSFPQNLINILHIQTFPDNLRQLIVLGFLVCLPVQTLKLPGIISFFF